EVEDEGALPTVAVTEAGRLPEIDVDPVDIDITTDTQQTVVPDIDITPTAGNDRSSSPGGPEMGSPGTGREVQRGRARRIPVRRRMAATYSGRVESVTSTTPPGSGACRTRSTPPPSR